MPEITLKPLSIRSTVLYFFFPAILVTINIFVVMAFFDSLGVSPFYNYALIYATFPMIVLLTASFIAYRREGNSLTWETLKVRFRLNYMSKKDWGWTFALFLFMFISVGILSVTSPFIASLFPPLDFWPDELNPLKRAELPRGTIPTTFMGEPLSGNWGIAFILLCSLVIATFGEEFWWRGYILPRQELQHGINTWIIHGLFWTLFHFFLPWNLLAILPGALALSYVAQKLQNTWPAIIAHGLANGLEVFMVVILGILN